jgi:hypothetical protein
VSGIASIEVFRTVLVADDLGFIEKTNTFARRITDEVGKRVVTLRTDNKPQLTIEQGSDVYDRLRYVHLRAAGENVRRLYKKTYDLRVKMDEGAPRQHINPLQQELDLLAERTYGLGEGVLFFSVELREVDVVTQLTSTGMGKFVVLKSSPENRCLDDQKMLVEMSAISRGYLDNFASDRLQEHVVESITDSVPLAQLGSLDDRKTNLFIDHVRELLPITVQVDREIQIETK